MIFPENRLPLFGIMLLGLRFGAGRQMSVAFVFPGQGSQAVGMGKALAEAFAPARAVFEGTIDLQGPP